MIHRSTLYYRLDRIRELTGSDLHDGRTRRELHTGIRIAQLAGLWGGRRPDAGAGSGPSAGRRTRARTATIRRNRSRPSTQKTQRNNPTPQVGPRLTPTRAAHLGLRHTIEMRKMISALDR